MQELIERQEVLLYLQGTIGLEPDSQEWQDIMKFPTTVHHEYKVGEEYEFQDILRDWHRGIFRGHAYSLLSEPHLDLLRAIKIRPLQSEHPDITQARELASKHGHIVIPKE